MSEFDLPPRQGDESEVPGWTGFPPVRRRPRHRRAFIVLVAALAAAAAVALALFSAGRVPDRPSTASAANPGGSAGRPLSVAQSARSSGAKSAGAIAAAVDPGLVDINVTFGMAGAQGSATGMVLTPSGVVLTNNHVISGATTISATDLGNGRTYTATVVGYDRTHDVAVLQLRGSSGLSTVPLGDSSTVTTGASVTAIGNAGGVGGRPSAARGLVTALGRTITASDAGGADAQRLSGLIETNADVRPGDSGGPLVNSGGRVIGMDAAASASFTLRPAATQGFAIPIDQALSIAKQIEAGTPSSTVHIGPTAFLGVELVPSVRPGGGGLGGSSGSGPGAAVGGVLSGYPAAQAGLTQGDAITSFGGRAVGSTEALRAMLSAHHPGDVVRLAWTDTAGGTHTATVTLAAGPAL